MSIKRSFSVFKNKQGGFTVKEKTRFDAFIANLPVGDYLLTLQQYYPKRTLPQNAYLHIIFDYIARHTGNDPDAVKDEMKRMFAMIDRPNIFTGEIQRIVQDTSAMDTWEMTVFIEKIRVWAGEFLSLDIPSPDDHVAIDDMRGR